MEDDAFAGDQSGAGADQGVTVDAQALAAAQAQLAADQAAHDQAAAQLATDQAALDAAVTKLSEDQLALADAQAAHDAAVAATAAAQTPPPVPESTGDVQPTTQLEAAHSMVDDIEAIAIKWGGDIGTDLRNLAGKLRNLFGEKPAADSAAQ